MICCSHDAPGAAARGRIASRAAVRSGTLGCRGEPGRLQRLAPAPWPDIPQRPGVRLPHQNALSHAPVEQPVPVGGAFDSPRRRAALRWSRGVSPDGVPPQGVPPGPRPPTRPATIAHTVERPAPGGVGMPRRAWPTTALCARALAGHPATSGRALAASACVVPCLCGITRPCKGRQPGGACAVAGSDNLRGRPCCGECERAGQTRRAGATRRAAPDGSMAARWPARRSPVPPRVVQRGSMPHRQRWRASAWPTAHHEEQH